MIPGAAEVSDRGASKESGSSERSECSGFRSGPAVANGSCALANVAQASGIPLAMLLGLEVLFMVGAW
jgi:hypothetical protein